MKSKSKTKKGKSLRKSFLDVLKEKSKSPIKKKSVKPKKSKSKIKKKSSNNLAKSIFFNFRI